ncbi:transcriptional regulator GlxA family with amidase domain [Kribbella sp. VKM Ac-2527]|uniref:Transcriptional regulator GlxA family with amidase domain n=1 Tax=Kribbella caucasensis TaxID=2512215 RepID=A0A4R6K5T6_9ACTN|nr:helix-turn-helix domain-containing protein [Kribbella sp. VKM Ac-2527]TDO43176.1 transcriptional regulator GlxA family with amidase domain [Kribbella sp. VKM Ac-2527]
MTIVAVLAIEGVIGLELTGACQVFATAKDPVDGRPLYDVRVCGGPAGTDVVAFDRGILRAQAPYGFEEALRADTVIVPASFDPPTSVVEVVREAHRRGIRIASICTGAYVLAEAGLLDGRQAATHWNHAAELARRYPEVDVVTDALYLDDGDVLTSAGVTAGLDLCLHLVRRDHGSAVAAAVARQLVMAPHRDGGQAQYIATPVVAGNDSLEPVLHWMTEHLTEPLTLATIAAQASLSTRSLSRRFRDQIGTTPLQWLIRARLARAQELLETTDLNIAQVAAAAGFGSPLLLRQHFTRTLNTTPTNYRRTFTHQAI